MKESADKFRSPLSRGNTISVLERAKSWFTPRGVNIVRYLYSRDVTTRNKGNLEDSDLKHCSICGCELYKMDEDSRYGVTDIKDVEIAQKRHMVFIDSVGDKHYTCYGLNWCFGRVGHDEGLIEDDEPIEFTPPSLADMVSPEINLSELQESFVEAATREYDRLVVPLLSKWINRPVNKSNVYEFVNEMNFVENKFLKLYCNGETFTSLKNKILNIIGVQG